MASDLLPFGSFWSGGFEGADHINGQGIPLDMIALTGHAAQLRADYRRANAAGMRTVRESVGWRITSRPHGYDFSRPRQMLREAARTGIGIAWTLWHYGIPPGVDPFDDSLPVRFAEFADTFARELGRDLPGRVWINPINEISFLTWLFTESGAIHPFPGNRKVDAPYVKRNLVAAGIAAAAAIRARLPGARFFHTDPVIGVVPPRDRPELAADAARFAASQYEAWDLFADADFHPEIAPADRFHLIGVNYYHSSQWEHETRRLLEWHLRDPRRTPIAMLLERARERYQRPLAITETSHFGSGRAGWMREVAQDLRLASTPETRSPHCAGICVYPLIDRPDWDDPARWHSSGLWDAVRRTGTPSVRRSLNRPYWNALKSAGVAGADAAAPHAARADGTRPRRAASNTKDNEMETLIVFSHLRWDFVYQRPQHILSRLARKWRVLYVEEPMRHDGHPIVETTEPAPNVTVLRFHTPLASSGFHDDQLALLKPMLADVLRQKGIHDYGVWMYTPMALPLLQGLKPRVICYDCMDELSAFLSSPKQLIQRETALLKIANVVFTGGPSLLRAKQAAHDNVFCLPSSVDARHFRRALRPGEALPELDQGPRPRLGFYGVIDERLDIALLEQCAQLKPEWQFQLVGPIAKIDPATLPQRPNIRYVGQQPYLNLPGVLAAWDVALLPFAHNASTRFISPTKTLEYLAAELPVVSTSIADVAELYGSAVAFADAAVEFVRACDRLLAEDDELRESRVAAAQSLVEATSWDATADKMIVEIERALPGGLRPDVALLFGEPSREAAERRSGRSGSRIECLIAGGGPTGLSAAYHYGAGATVLEARAHPGGWCRSISDGGFTFDHAGHIMFSDSPIVLDLYDKLLGSNVLWQNREAWVYSHDRYTRYPFQAALYGLPPAVTKECLLGAIEARYGPAAAANGPDSKASAHRDCCADGTSVDDGAATEAIPAETTAAVPRNFEEFIYRTWGRGIAAHFAVPYNRKLWGVPLSEMETSWLGGRVPLPDLEQMIEGALEPVAKPMGPNARFGYPLRGGFQALTDGFLPLLQGPVLTEAEVANVNVGRHEVELADGRRFRYEALISTIPLPVLVAAIGSDAPPEIRQAALLLRRVSVRCVNLGIGRPSLTEKHWIYYPGDTIFHRIFVQGNASPYCNAPGGFGLTCEISYSPTKPLPLTGRALIQRCIDDCIRVGMFRRDDPVWVANEVDLPYAYVLYDHERAKAVATIRSWLAEHDIVLAGRYSEWEYYNSDHAFLAGKRAADELLAAESDTPPATKSAAA